MSRTIKLHDSWRERLNHAFSQNYMLNIWQFLHDEKQAGKTIFPAPYLYFSALNLTPFDAVKVVILGQDPYHGLGQAHGLCFSVPPDMPLPPSLRNIYKELHNDLGLPMANHGSLVAWAMQGVLLLNSVLTVEQHAAASHRGRGWESFTDAIIHVVNEQAEHMVFILWGNDAQKKGGFIDESKHLVIKAPHPSPLSAHRGFFGGRYFSRCNEYLLGTGRSPVSWALPEREAAMKQFHAATAINQAITQGTN